MNKPFTKATWLAAVWWLLLACNNTGNAHQPDQQSLAEISGMDVVVINEAEKITHATATQFRNKKAGVRHLPADSTGYLPGISLLVDGDNTSDLVDTLNSRLLLQNCMAFISEDNYRSDRKKRISIVRTLDKYDIVRLQATCKEGDSCCTDSLIEKLKQLDQKYAVDFIAVAKDWMILRPHGNIINWQDYALETLKICPPEEGPEDIEAFVTSLKEDKGKITLWWE